MKNLSIFSERPILRYRTRVFRWICLMGLGGLAAFGGPLSAQAQNPFDTVNPFGAGDPFQQGGAPGFGAAAPGAGPPADPTVVANPLVDALLRQDLTDPAKRMAVAETLLLIGQPQQAETVLAEFRQPLTAEEASQFVLQVTSARMLWLQGREDVSEAMKSWLAATLKNAMEYSLSEAATESTLQVLLDGTPLERPAAHEKLQASGMAAAMPILSRIQALLESDELDSGRLRRLIQVIQNGSDEWDSALRSLVGRSSRLESAAILGLAARGPSAVNQAVVLEWTMRETGELPEPKLENVITYWRTQMQSRFGLDVADAEVTRRWLKDLNRAYLTRWQDTQDPRFRRTQSQRQLWLYDSTAEGLLLQETDAIQELARDHVLVATAWLRADAESEAALRNFVAAQFQRAKLLQGVDEPLPDGAVEIAAQHLNPEQMSDMLRVALEEKRWLVAQSLIEALQTLGNHDLLASTSGRLAPVVTALQATDQRVRFAAVKTILTWQPTTSFPGASYFNQTLSELLSSPLRSEAVVASMNPYHASYLAAMTRSAGWDAGIVSSAAQLIADFKMFPISFLVLTDSLGEIPYVTVIEQIRSAPQGETVPILLLLRPENMTHARKLFQVERVDRYLIVAEFSEEGRDLMPWFDELARIKAVGTVIPTRAARATAQDALQLLQPWLANNAMRKRLDLSSLARPTQNLIGAMPALVKPATELLSYYGDPETQVYLSGLAGDTGTPVAVRSAAAQAFRDSVQRFGTLLTTKQIEIVYDRQNRSERDDKSTQEILNSVLDTLEARYRRTPFDQLPPVPETF